MTPAKQVSHSSFASPPVKKTLAVVSEAKEFSPSSHEEWLDNPILEEILDKTYGQSKWEKAELSRQLDDLCYQRAVKHKKRRHSARLAAKGRKNCQHLAVPHSFVSEAYKVSEDWLVDLSIELDIDRDKLYHIMCVQMSFFGNLLVCETAPQIAAATLQMVSGMLASTQTNLIPIVMDKIGDWFTEKRFEYYFDADEPESDDEYDSADDMAVPHGFVKHFRDKLQAVKEDRLTFQSIPMWKSLSKVLMIGAFLGFLPPGDSTATASRLDKCLASWTSSYEREAQSMSLVDAVLDSCIFACDFISAVQDDDLSRLTTPTDLQSRCLELVSQRDAWKSGQLHLLTDKKSPQEYLQELRDAMKELKVMVASTPHGPIRVAFQSALTKVTSVYFEVETGERLMEPQIAAPIIGIYGDSQVGKSYVAHHLIQTLGSAGDFATDTSRIWYRTQGDAYESGYSGLTNVVVEDDKDAIKEKYAKVEDLASDIKDSNTMPVHALRAEAECKGNIKKCHKVKIMTSNSQNFGLFKVFTTPKAAINRNWMYHFELNPDFASKHGTADPDKFDPNAPIEPHQFYIREYRYEEGEIEEEAPPRATKGKRRKGKGKEPEKTVKRGWTPVYGQDWNHFGEWLEDMAKKYKQHQVSGKKYVDKIKYAQTCARCSVTHVPKDVCTCTECSLWQQRIQHYGEEERLAQPHARILEHVFGVAKYEAIALNPVLGYVMSYLPSSDSVTTAAHHFVDSCQLVRFPMVYIRYSAHRLIRTAELVYLRWGVNRVGGGLIRLFAFLLQAVKAHFVLRSWAAILLVNLCACLTTTTNFWSVRCCFLLQLVALWLMAENLKRMYTASVLTTIMNEDPFSKGRVALRCATVGAGVAAILCSVKAVSKFWNMSQAATPQGNLVPKTKEDVEERAAETNPWLSIVPTGLVVPGPVNNMTFEQSKTKVNGNLCWLEQKTPKHNMGENVWFCMDNVMLVPRHFYDELCKDTPFTLIRSSAPGARTPSVGISRAWEYTPDIMVAVVTRSPNFADLRHMLPHDIYKGSATCIMLSKCHNGLCEERMLKYEYQERVGTTAARNEGSTHKMSAPSRVGLCGSVLVTVSKPHVVIGFHVGGYEKPELIDNGVCFSLCRSKLDQGIDKLKEMDVATPHSYCGDPPLEYQPLELESFGKPLVNLTPTLHERDAVHWTNPPSEEYPHTITVLGSDPSKRTRTYSSVLETSLSPHLSERGRPQKWNKPHFNSNKNYSATYQAMQKPERYVPVDVLTDAVEDYVVPIIEEVKRLELEALPLTDLEVVNGVPGHRFIKGMNMDTSPGVGLASPKRQHFDEYEENGRIVRVMKDYLLDEFNKCDALLNSGVVPSMLIKTALKDEPTPIEKGDKVRVFYILPMVINMLIRKYILPIMAVRYAMPLLCECFQAINCTNDEWDQIANHFRSYSVTQCIAGDHSKYDLCFSGQMLRAVGHVMGRIGRALGYNDQQVRCVELLHAALAKKHICFNGTVIALDSLSPSGGSSTVDVNSCGNSLHHRVCYFNEIKRKQLPHPGPFRLNIAAGFVGDDTNLSSKLTWFNQRFLQQSLAEFGLKYTDAHKNEVAEPFVHFDEMSLCKRTYFYRPDVGGFVAPIETDSIYKSLHCRMESKTCDEDILSGNASQALRELARHPKAVFEQEAAIIRGACEARGINHLVKYIDSSYEEWAVLLAEKWVTVESSTSGTPDGSESLSESLD